MRCLALLSFFLLVSCSVHFPFPRVASPAPSGKTVPVWLIAGDLHCDLVVETAWLTRSGCRLPKSVRPYKYVCFGWGDRVAYTHRWGLDDVPQALFWETESIVQVVAFNTDVEPTFPQLKVVKSNIPTTNGPALANFFNHSFRFPSEGAPYPITLKEAKWGHGYFIASPYSYYAPRMCNQWVSTALVEAGVYTARPAFYNNPMSMISQMKKFNAQQSTQVLR